MSRRNWSPVIAGVALAMPIAHIARAESYLTESAAGPLLLPGVKLSAGWADLTPAQAAAIAKKSGERVLNTHVRVWWGPAGEAMFIDQVVGKHELITYAMAVDAGGKVAGVEILEYRETFGYEIRQPRWRHQFVGKTAADPVRIGKDIQNISGATLSSLHVTSGVRRLLDTYDVLKAKS